MKELGEIYFMSNVVQPTGGDVDTSARLAAGHSLTSGYNAGKLSTETVSGYYPNVSAVAVVSDPSSPINGQTIHLIETEGFSLPAASAFMRIS